MRGSECICVGEEGDELVIVAEGCSDLVDIPGTKHHFRVTPEWDIGEYHISQMALNKRPVSAGFSSLMSLLGWTCAQYRISCPSGTCAPGP